MLELEFIPLKTADGTTRGHARVRGGYVEATLRSGQSGEVLIVADTGTFTGRPGARIRVNGAVQAVALHEGETLLCCGFARKSPLTRPDVARRLAPAHPLQEAARDFVPAPPAFEKGPGPAPVVTVAAPEEAQTPAPASAEPKRARPAPEKEAAPLSAGDGLPFSPDTAVKQALSRLASETAEDLIGTVLPSRRMPVSVPATAIIRGRASGNEKAGASAPKTAEETAADTEAFSAMLARAEAVFQRIAARPEDWDAAPAPAPAEQVAPEPVEKASPPPQAPPDDWQAACDRLLAASGPRPVRTAAQNPFPHIFPGARFQKTSFAGSGDALSGDWMSGGEPVRITAVPGEYSPRPPERLAGFTRYIRTRAGGYWVRVEPR